MKNFKKIVIAVAALIALVGQQYDTLATNPTTPYVGITPYDDIIEVSPGKSYTGTFQVVNLGNDSFDYELSISPYQVSDLNYEPIYEEKSTYNQITDWISFSRDVGHLEAQSTSEHIYYTINVPLDAPAGGQYAAIEAVVHNEKDINNPFQIDMTTNAAMIIYASVDGESRYTGDIIENNVPGFLLSAPLATSTLVENTGNVHTMAKNTLQVFPLFSDEEVYTNEETPHEALIMPESQRYVTQTWDKTPPVGIFKVRQTVKIFDETSINEKIVVICPLWLICVVIFAIIAAIIYLVAKSKARKKSTK